jgi:hypothetical protein
LARMPGPNKPMTAKSENLRPATSAWKGSTPLLLLLAFLSLFPLAACQSDLRFTVETLPRYEALFRRPSGWTGGDGAYSAALGGERFLWLFGDSLIGEVRDGRRIHARLVNNSIAIQSGQAPGTASVDFFYQTLADGTPAAFVRPEDGPGWFWPGHAVRTGKGLYIFLLQVGRAGASGPFDFRPAANWLGHVDNPEEDPGRWVVSRCRVPWGNENRIFGLFVLSEGAHCYIYGITVDPGPRPAKKHLILARAPTESLGNFDSWRFFAKGDWVADVDRASRVCENVASEFSVSYQPAIKRFVLVYTEDGLSANIVIRNSPTPQGPWSAPTRVYRCPEARRDPRVFCYAAKGHPEIAASPAELIVTYLANSTDFELVQSEATLYRPRFLRILFAHPEKN